MKISSKKELQQIVFNDRLQKMCYKTIFFFSDKHEYLTSQEILPPYQRKVISLLILLQERLWKNTIEKQTKTIKDKEEKQIKIIKEHGKKLVESNALVKKWL